MLVEDKSFPRQDCFLGLKIPVHLLQLSNPDKMSKNSQVNEVSRVQYRLLSSQTKKALNESLNERLKENMGCFFLIFVLVFFFANRMQI